VAVAVLFAACGTCDKHETAAGGAPSATVAPETGPLLEAADEAEAARSARPQQKGVATQAGEKITVPAGTLVAGSTPGDHGRDPALEPALLSVSLGEYQIDKLPYPNDPSQRPLTGVTRAKAAALCAERDGRLCNELEWERACRGAEGQQYAGGDVWDGACAKDPQTCASAFGVLALGGAMREWTASDVLPIKDLLKQGAAVRGTQADAADVDHRCAHRTMVDPASHGGDLGFRCCYGAAPDARIESPDWQPTFRKAEMPAERLAELFKSSKRLAALAEDIKYFREESAVDTVIRRGKSRAKGDDAGAPPPTGKLGTGPLLWNPAPGEEILLVTGQSKKDSFIVAFHRLPDDRYRVGAAMLLENELGPIIFSYNANVRRKLQWAICWGCYAENGDIHYREENRVAITQD
jgi:hypothetical protein